MELCFETTAIDIHPHITLLLHCPPWSLIDGLHPHHLPHLLLPTPHTDTPSNFSAKRLLSPWWFSVYQLSPQTSVHCYAEVHVA